MNNKEFFEKYRDHGDEWCYEFAFYGDSDEEAFAKLKSFLIDEGFGIIPIPPTARRLCWDYLKPDSDGNYFAFVWHPIKIYQDPYQVYGLNLFIFDESHPDHMALWEGTYSQQ